MDAIETKVVNGIDVNAMFTTIDQIKSNPDIAKFQFRAKNKWIDGANNQASVKDFHGALQENDSRNEMSFDEDEPPVLLGSNKGPNPMLRGSSKCSHITHVPLFHRLTPNQGAGSFF